MGAKLLTQGAVKGAKPKDKPYKLYDPNRLFLLVSVAGSKTWKWNYRLDGKDCTYTIGPYPQIGLAEAREKRIELSKLVKAGTHPREQDDELRHKAKAEKLDTFWANAEKWIQKSKLSWTPYYLKQVQTYLVRYAGPETEFGKRPIKQISAPDIATLVSSIALRASAVGMERKTNGAPALARLVRQWCGAVFRYAIAIGSADRNPVSDLKASDIIARPKVKSNLALSRTQLFNLHSSIRNYSGHRQVAIAAELLMHTFVRTGELRQASWSEINWERAEWTIPSSRMKIKNVGDHVVPLSNQCIALLQELRAISGTTKNSNGPAWLFPNMRDPARCMSSTTINRLLERLGFNGKDSIGFAAHGFRGTASTLLHENKVRPEVIEVQLAHKERNSVKAAYNKAQYLDERKLMMQQWSNFIESLSLAQGTSGDSHDAHHI